MKVYETVSDIIKNEFEFAVTTAEPFLGVEGLLADAELSGFCEKDIKKRIFPRLTMKNANSIICILFPYKTRDENNRQKLIEKRSVDTAKIASGDVWLGEDYHFYVKRRLREICEQLVLSLGGEYMAFSDTGPLIDKEIAVRSGLCKYGRNSLAINGKLGSFFYIGYILTDIHIESVSTNNCTKLFELCVNCDRCIRACPAGALHIDMPFEHKRCVSYISQKKGELTQEEAISLGDTVYGCHICQNVCPANKNEEYAKYIDISEINLSNKEFKKKYGDTAARFIGKNIFMRNASAVRCNSRKGS